MHTSRATARKPSLASLRRKSLPLSLSLLLCGALAVTPAQAGSVGRTTTPTGGSIVGGSGSIVQDGASVVINQASQKLALDWQSFNLGQDATVRFNQPGASAVALNRILDQNPSQIFGQVSSNGQVFLINTHGIIFGATAQVNVGGLVASTLDLTPTDFLSNHFNLDKVGGGAGIVNHGTIVAASGGSVSLIGGSVHNDGVILANYGRINLDGADHAVLDFDGNGLINVQITGALKQRLDAKAAVDNAGALHADGGTVVLEASAARDLFTSLVNNSGVIDAGAISQDGGVVRLVARGGDVIDDGRIDATGVHGGSVQLLSDRNVGVTGGRIDASGASGGGHIRVGGGWQGGEGLQTAEAVYVAADATLKADATHKGDGGSVVVWGNRTNNFYGAISARGGAAGGAGGRVETSAHDGLNAQGRVDAAAPAGHAGTWLLDPHDVRIVSGTAGDPLSGTSPDAYFSAAADDSQIGADVIGSALDDGTNVSVFTGTDGVQDGNITVEAPITAAGAGSLYLKAAGSIFLDADIAGNGTDPLGVHLWANYGGAADDTTYVGRAVCANCEVVVGHTAGASITTGGGVLDIRTGDALHAGGTVTFGNDSATGSIESGAFTVQATGITIDGASYTFDTGDTTLDAGEGDVTLAGDLNFGGDLTVTGDQITLGNGPNVDITAKSQSYNGAVVLGADAMLTANSGAVSLAGGLDGGGSDLTIDGDAVLGPASGVGTLSVGGATTLNGNVTTAGAQTYDGAVTLAGDAMLASSGNAGIGFGSTVDGAHALTVNTGGVTGFGGAVGATTALTSLTTDVGGSTSLGGDVHTTGAQIYHDTLTLAGDATLSSTGNADIVFGSTVNGAHALVVNTGGITGFGGTIGAGTALASLTTDATGSTSLGGDVKTTGAQVYKDAVNLSGDAILTSSGNADIVFAGTVDGAHTLRVNTGGATGFGGAVGAGTALASLATDTPGTLTLGGNVTTSGMQTYAEAVTLTGDRIFTSTGSGDITFGSTVDGAHALVVNTGGVTRFGGAIGTGSALTGLTTDNGGSTSLGGDVTTTGAQSYGDAVTLQTDAALASTSGGDIAFGSTVDGAHALAVNTGGSTRFGGAVGAATALTSLATDAPGGTVLGGDVTTSDTQIYGDAVALNADVTVASTGGDIVFASMVDGPHALAANAAGALAFNGAVGGATALTGLTTGSATFNAADKLDIDGNLAVTTTGGEIGQAGAFNVTGTARFDAGNQAIVLDNGDNAFGGAVSLATTGVADVVLVDHGPLLLGNVSTDTGQLSLTSLDGGISQQGGTAIVQAAGAGVAEFKATGAVDLSSAGNDFTGALNVTGTSVSINDINDLAVSYLDSTAGEDVSLIAGGVLALTGDVDTGGGDLTLASNGGVLEPMGKLSGGNVSLRGRDGVSLAHEIIATGTLGLASDGGPIVQTGGTLGVAGASTIDAGTGAIALISAGNDFGGAVSLAGGATQIVDSNALTLGTLATGDLTATSTGPLNLGSGTVDGMLTASSNNGAVTQGGGLAVTGTSGIDAGTGAITLADTDNDFGGVVTLSGGVTQITDKNALTLGTLATGDLTAISSDALNLGKGVVSGNLTANSQGGAIGQSGALTITGTAGIDAGTGAITLADAGNDFAGTVDLTGGNTQITDTNTLTLGTLDTGDLTADSTGTLNLGAGTVDGMLTAHSHGGAIGQSGPLNVTGAGAIDAGGGSITLIDADNDFVGPVSLAGGVTQITDKNALTLGTLATGDLTAISSGALNLGKSVVSGNLTAGSQGGAIGQSGALTITGTAGIDAGTGAITLADAGNDFAGTVDLTGGNTQITDTNTLTLGTLDTGDLTANSTGSLDLGTGTVDGMLTALSHGGAIGQSGPLKVAGAGAIDAAGGTITLIDANNDFVGAVSLAGGVTQITDKNALTLGTLATGELTAISSGALNLGKGVVSGNLTANSQGGAIVQTGALTITGTAGIDAGAGAITLADANNDFAGTVDLTGGNTQITDTNTLTLGTLATGDLTANSTGSLDLGTGTVDGTLTALSHGGAIGQSGPLKVAGAGAIDAAGGTITLIDANNDFVGAVSLAGGVTQITDKNALALGTLATGDLTAISSGALNLGKGVVSGNLTANSQGGAIGQSGALTITGTSGIDAGAGAITLADAGNDFQGSVNLAGKGIMVNDATDLTIGTLAHAANSSVSLSAGDSLILPTAAIATGTGDLLLAARHGTLATPGALSGANVSLSGGNGLDLAHDVSASGTLTLASASGDIRQTAGTLSAHTLAGNAGGSVTLGQANAIERLGNFASNGLILVDSSALAVVGPVDGGAGAVLIHSDGMLSVAGGIKGAQVALQGAGGIRQSSGTIDAGTGQVILASDAGIVQTGGSIVAGTLVGSANGDASLVSANRVDRLGGFSAGNFSMHNGQALAVNGPLTVTGDITIATTAGKLALNTDLAGDDVSLSAGGDLVLGADLAGDSVVLRSGGAISQGSGNTLTADRLSGQSSGTTTLDQANAIGALGDFRANGLNLTSVRALTIDGTVDGGGRTGLTVGGDLAIAGTLAGDAISLAVAGAISETAGGGITAHTLDGHATGAASLTGANRVDTLGAFTAAGFALSNGPTLTVAGPLDGGASVSLATTRGDLLINGKVSGKATMLASSGAITEGQGGSITADTLSGHAGGPTRLGTAATPLANYIGTLGGFSSPAGFSLTNAQTLTLASVGGSSYTVDAGTSALYLGVTGGDLLQADKTWLYDGEGAFSSTGRIGTADAPIYVTGTGAQAVAMVGLPPAYFYALNRKGNLLPLTGGSSVNVPTSLFTSRAQNANNHTDVYIDPSVISANYRSFGIVPSGILLPPDQQACDPELEECDE